MPQTNTGFVIVSKDWFDTPGVYQLIGRGRPRRSTGDAHTLIGPVSDANNHLGLWLGPIGTTELTTDGSPVVMRFLIPWRFVLGLGVETDSSKPRSVGFNTNDNTTILADTD